MILQKMFLVNVQIKLNVLNIFLTSIITGIKLELKNNLESEMSLNNQKLKYVHNIQFEVDIY